MSHHWLHRGIVLALFPSHLLSRYLPPSSYIVSLLECSTSGEWLDFDAVLNRRKFIITRCNKSYLACSCTHSTPNQGVPEYIGPYTHFAYPPCLRIIITARNKYSPQVQYRFRFAPSSRERVYLSMFDSQSIAASGILNLRSLAVVSVRYCMISFTQSFAISSQLQYCKTQPINHLSTKEVQKPSPSSQLTHPLPSPITRCK